MTSAESIRTALLAVKTTGNRHVFRVLQWEYLTFVSSPLHRDSAEGLRHLHELRTTRDIQNDMRGLDGSSSSMEHDGDHSGQLGSLNHSLMDAFNQHSGDLSPTGRRGMFADSVGSAGSGGRGLFQPSGGRGDSASRSRSMFQEDSDVQDDALLYGSLNNSDEAPFTP